MNILRACQLSWLETAPHLFLDLFFVTAERREPRIKNRKQIAQKYQREQNKNNNSSSKKEKRKQHGVGYFVKIQNKDKQKVIP